MPVRSLLWLLAVGTALFLAAPVSAEAAMDAKATAGAKPPQPRTDLYGDPLPAGAVARLGMARLCQQVVNFLAFSPDDKTVAALDNGCLRLWDVQTGRELRHFDDPHAGENAAPVNVPLVFSPDGKFVAWICGRNAVRVWETATGRERYTFQDLPFKPSDLAIDPKARFLAAGAGMESILLWNLQDGKRLPSCEARLPMYGMTFSADGTRLIAAVVAPDRPPGQTRVKFLHFYSESGKLVRDVSCDFYPLSPGGAAPDGALFVAPTKGAKSFRLLSTSDGKEVRRTEGDANKLEQVRFSGDGRFLTASSADDTVRVWGVADGKLVHEFKAPGGVTLVALSHDGKLLALAGPADDAIHIWDLEKSEELHHFAGHRSGPLSVVFSKDGKSVFTANRDGIYELPSRPPGDWSLREWDPATGKELRVTKADLKGRVYYANFSHDGRLLVVFTYDDVYHLWEVAAGKELRRWKAPAATTAVTHPDKRLSSFAQAPMGKPLFSADGRVLFAGAGADATFHRWDTTTGEELSPWKTSDGESAGAAQPSPAGDKGVLVTTLGQGVLHMTWMDATTGQVVRQLWECGRRITRFAWDVSPDGRTLAASDGSGVAFVEIASGRGRGGLENEVGKTANLMFSPDGRLLTAVGDGEVRLWRVATGDLVGRLEGCGGQADCLAFSPDSKRLAVSEGRNTVLIFDVDALAATVPPSAALTEKELAAFWNDLSAADGARAFRALGRLSADPVRVVAFVKERWKPAPELDAHRIDRLLADLDDDEFAVREKASEELERHTPKTEESMRRALLAGASAEAAHRIHQIMKDLQTPQTSPPSPELTNLRVVELLETCGTDGARNLLQALAKGPEDAQLTREARAALGRMAGGGRHGS